MTTQTETKSETPSTTRDAAERDGRPVEDVGGRKVRPEMMAHFEDSIRRHYRLGELLAR